MKVINSRVKVLGRDVQELLNYAKPKYIELIDEKYNVDGQIYGYEFFGYIPRSLTSFWITVITLDKLDEAIDRLSKHGTLVIDATILAFGSNITLALKYVEKIEPELRLIRNRFKRDAVYYEEIAYSFEDLTVEEYRKVVEFIRERETEFYNMYAVEMI